MAYVSMTTRSAGYVVPASEYNQFIANDEACAVAGFTTKGDLFAATASKAGARLAAGADYWGLGYLAANSSGIAKAPNPTLLVSAGYQRVVNSAVETTIATVTIPANALGTNGVLLFETWLWVINNKGSSGTIQVKSYYGATNLVNNYTQDYTHGNSANPAAQQHRAIIAAYNATNVQKGLLITGLYEAAGTAQYGPRFQSPVAFAIDSTAAQTAKITAKMDVAHASFEFTCLYASIAFCPIGALT